MSKGDDDEDTNEYDRMAIGKWPFAIPVLFKKPKTLKEDIASYLKFSLFGPFDALHDLIELLELANSIFPDLQDTKKIRECSRVYGQYSKEWYAVFVERLYRKYVLLKNGGIDSEIEFMPIDFSQMDSEARSRLCNEIFLQIGMTMMQARIKLEHEAATREGYLHKEGRAVGQPLAARARKKAGDERRQTILRLARVQMTLDPSLAGNMTKLATAILRTNDPGLLHRHGLPISHEMVRKRLTEFRKDGSLWESS